MSKIADIRYQIDQLDGGTFQRLCDSYLYYRGYGNGYSLGMNSGTNKTAPGSPDTYFLTADKRYILVMYTTQKRDFVSKVIDDINKCFNPEKTGISAECVAEIIYCHTYGRLTPGEDQRLRTYCASRGALLTLIGLDVLSNDIFRKYPILAKDYFGISVDTGQIMPLDIFVATHDANEISAPLKTNFLFREKELDQAIASLQKSDVLLISGPAGIGKTRFALELCQKLSALDSYSVLCVRSNNLPLYEDLIAAIEEDKKYLVLIDDANELSGLRHIFEFLPKAINPSRHIEKIVLTVRDYARKQVMREVLDFCRPEIIKLDFFTDENICELIKTCYGITNRVFKDRIVNLANGNARLAMLAGKLATQTQDISSIMNASDLYDAYYDKQIRKLISSETGLISGGIIAFVQAIHLDFTDAIEPVFNNTGITKAQFESDLHFFHEAELVDLCNDKAARISDQSFRNFLIKYVFVDKKLISLSLMIETCFTINQASTISACNILMNVFLDSAVQSYVISQIELVWDKLEGNESSFAPFFKAFHMVRPTQTLILLKSQIEEMPAEPFDVQSLQMERKEPSANIADYIIEMLCDFQNHTDLPTAIDLLLLYYAKRPSKFESFYAALASNLGINTESIQYNYYTQVTVVNHLCEALNTFPNDINLIILFVHTAGYYLKFDFSSIKAGRGNAISFYHLTLRADDAVLAYRKELWKKLYEIYARGYARTEIENILFTYPQTYAKEADANIIKCDLKLILQFFSLLDRENLYHCIIAQNIKKTINLVNCDDVGVLASFLENDKFQIYWALQQNDDEMFASGHEKGIQLHKARVKQLVQHYNGRDVDFMWGICQECSELFGTQDHGMYNGIGYAFDIFRENKILYMHAVESYIKHNTPFNWSPYAIIGRLFDFASPVSIKCIIEKYTFLQQNTWLWCFYSQMPEHLLSSRWATELLDYLEHPDNTLAFSPFRKIEKLEKYNVVDPLFIFNAICTVLNHFDEAPFVSKLYFGSLLNPTSRASSDLLIERFGANLVILEELYLKVTITSSHEDYDGMLLFSITNADPSFLVTYLNEASKYSTMQWRSIDVFGDRLSYLWRTDDYAIYANTVFEFLCSASNDKVACWECRVAFTESFKSEQMQSELLEKQNGWIAYSIDRYHTDKVRISILFSLIRELPVKRRKWAIEYFLSLNDDPEIFEVLSLEPSSFGGTGSLIPAIQQRIDFLSSLLPSVSGLKYLRQKNYIEKKIEEIRSELYEQEIRELLEAWNN